MPIAVRFRGWARFQKDGWKWRELVNGADDLACMTWLRDNVREKYGVETLVLPDGETPLSGPMTQRRD